MLCKNIVLICGFLIPLYCCLFAFHHAYALFVTNAKSTLRLRISLFCSFPIPFSRLSKIFFFNASSKTTIVISEGTLCVRVAHFCCFLVPSCRFSKIHSFAYTTFITAAQAILCILIALFCCFLIPLCSFLFIHFYTIAIIIAITKQILRICDSLLCRFPKPFYGFFIIHFYTISAIVALAKLILCLRITLLCGLAVQLYSLCLVLINPVTSLIALAQFILRFWTFLFCRFGVPLYSRLIVREFHIQPPGHILRCCISLSCRRFVPSAGLFVVLFNAPSLIIALAQCALCLGIALLCGLFVPHDRIFFVFFHTSAVLIAPGHFKLCHRAPVISGRDHVLLERHFRIACLLIILGIMQVVLLGFLLRFLLRFLAQTEAFHTSHKLLLFIFRANKQEAVHSIVLIAGIHLLDFSTQTTPPHAAHRRFKPLLDRFCLDGLRDFHFLSTHTDGLQLIRKTHFYLNFAHILSLLMVL